MPKLGIGDDARRRLHKFSQPVSHSVNSFIVGCAGFASRQFLFGVLPARMSSESWQLPCIKRSLPLSLLRCGASRRQNTDGSNCRRRRFRSRTQAGARSWPGNFPSGPNRRRNSLFGGDPALHHRFDAVRKRMIDQPAASALVALEDPIEPVHREVVPHQMGKIDIVVAVLDPA